MEQSDKEQKQLNEVAQETQDKDDGNKEKKPLIKTEILDEFANQTQERKKRKGRGVMESLNYYGIPLFGITLFIIVLIFGTIPAINTIVDRINQIQERNTEIDSLNLEIRNLEKLKESESQFLSDLDIIEQIIPSQKTQVAKFVGEIQDLAEKNDLEESNYVSGEEIEEIEEEVEESILSDTPALIHIPTRSNYIAKFNNIENFLNALYQKDDFIIMSKLDMQGHEYRLKRAEELEKQGQDVTFKTDLSRDEWTMDVTFEKFQFSRGFDEYVKQNLISVKSIPHEDTIQFIRERYSP